MRHDERGITLVEIIIAIAASVIVIGAATLFIRNALKSYGVAENMVDLQIEAQVLMEQLATWVMEGNYVQKKDDPAVENNSVFIIYYIAREAPEGIDDPDFAGKNWMRVFWCDGKGKLYMHKEEDSEGEGKKAPKEPNLDEYSDYSSWGLDDRSQLSKYVEGFKVEYVNESDSTGSPNKVRVTLSMKAGIQEYEFTDEIKIRNVVYETAVQAPETEPENPSPEEPEDP